MSYDVGHRGGLGPTWLWLWCRLTATAPIRHLFWEFPYATRVALNRQKKKKKCRVRESLQTILRPWACKLWASLQEVLVQDPQGEGRQGGGKARHPHPTQLGAGEPGFNPRWLRVGGQHPPPRAPTKSTSIISVSLGGCNPCPSSLGGRGLGTQRGRTQYHAGAQFSASPLHLTELLLHLSRKPPWGQL